MFLTYTHTAASILVRWGSFTYTLPAESLILSEFYYFAIYEKSEKNQPY